MSVIYYFTKKDEAQVPVSKKAATFEIKNDWIKRGKTITFRKGKTGMVFYTNQLQGKWKWVIKNENFNKYQ